MTVLLKMYTYLCSSDGFQPGSGAFTDIILVENLKSNYGKPSSEGAANRGSNDRPLLIF